MVTSIRRFTWTEDKQTLVMQPLPFDSPLHGDICVPGDKSISHRALILGAIAQGETCIEGLLLAEDIFSTAQCLKALGVNISNLAAKKVYVQGIDLAPFKEPTDTLNAGNSGTTMRLMVGLLAAQSNRYFILTGDSSLRIRPMSRVVKPLAQMGAKIWGRNSGALAPLAIHGERLRPIHYHSPIASAQVKSCLLLAGLQVEGKTTITEPSLSRDHSERMLKAFGADLKQDPETKSVSVQGPVHLQGKSVFVPGDISSAAFWLVAAAITPGSDLQINNVGINPTRTGILDALWKMGADITFLDQSVTSGEPVANLRVRYSPLSAIQVAGELVVRLIDEIPILAVAALFAEGTTIIRDAAELRVKESDRLAAIATQLNKMGAAITELPDGLEIRGNTHLRGAEVDGCNDHRIAMSLAVAALKATGITTLHRATAANISYPEFFTTLQRICS